MGECIKKVRIADIKIIDRIRKDLGNLEELAEDIARNGLINYPVVTPDNVLIAGERRIKACQLLGWEEIPVKVMSPRDYEHQLLLEISENENRKEFTFSERMEYARRLEQVERLKAKERQAHGQTAPGKTLQENFPEALERGQTRDKVAELVGFGSGKTYEKAKFVAEHADPETIRKLDAGEISIHRAYQEVRAKLEAAERAAREAEARAEAERRRAEELAARLAEAEKALAGAKAGSDEAEKHRAEVERLKRELEELKTRQPQVIEKVVEVPVEKVVYRPDPALEAELEAARAEAAKLLREKEWFEGRFREAAQEKERKEAKVRALEEEVERLRRWLDHARSELKKEKERPKPPQWSKEHQEFRALMDKANEHAASLATALKDIKEKHAERLLAAARVRGTPSDDVGELGEAVFDALHYKMFETCLNLAASWIVEVWELLEPGRPKLKLVKRD